MQYVERQGAFLTFLVKDSGTVFPDYLGDPGKSFSDGKTGGFFLSSHQIAEILGKFPGVQDDLHGAHKLSDIRVIASLYERFESFNHFVHKKKPPIQ